MSSSMASEIDHHQLHFLLIPLMSQSHIIPLTDFAKLLANRGLIVSIITTPLNAIRYKRTIERAVENGMKIKMIPLEFQGQEFGIPQGCENMDELISMDLATQFFSACELLKTPLEKLIEEMEPKPSCIVSTSALSWTQQIATKFNVPRYVFETISCFTQLCSRKLSQAKNQGIGMSDSERFLVPDIPHEIEFTKAQLPETMRKSSDSFKGVLDQIIAAKRSARGTLVNSFEELEPWYVEENKKGRQNFWCIGPVSLCNKNFSEKIDRGNQAASVDENYCISWLDWMKPRSVIYVCFGSLCRISAAQIKEIGLGLEASSFPFVWIIRGLDCSGEVEKWLREEEFEERVQGRGLIIRGWAPQVLILSHPSVGGFMTHCGWNSTLEGVSAGVPMITWPMFAEQFYNEKFIVHVLEIGVRVGVEAGAKLGTDEECKSFMTRDRVEKSIERLMVETEEGKERRKRAQKLGKMAKVALEQRGSSNMNISFLIQDVIKQSMQ